MSGTASYSFKIKVATTLAGSYVDIPSISGSFNRTSDVLDVTDTTNVGIHQRLLNLLDTAVNTEANWVASDAALTMIEAALTERSALFVKFLPAGTPGTGYKLPVVVESFNITSGVSDAVKVSISFQGNGAVVVDNG